MTTRSSRPLSLIESLPNEVLLDIFSYLDVVEDPDCLYSLQRTCALFKCCVSSPMLHKNLMWGRFGMDREPSRTADEPKSYSKELRRALQGLKNMCSDFHHRTLEEDEFLMRWVVGHGYYNLLQRLLRVYLQTKDTTEMQETCDPSLTPLLKPENDRIILRKLVSPFCYVPDNPINPLLHIACERGRPKVLSILLELGVDPNIACSCNINERAKCWLVQCAPIHVASFTNNLECLKILISYKANVNAIHGRYDQTPVHIVCQKGHIEAFQLLLKNGAKYWLTDRHNLSCYTLAKAYKQNTIMENWVSLCASAVLQPDEPHRYLPQVEVYR